MQPQEPRNPPVSVVTAVNQPQGSGMVREWLSQGGGMCLWLETVSTNGEVAKNGTILRLVNVSKWLSVQAQSSVSPVVGVVHFPVNI